MPKTGKTRTGAEKKSRDRTIRFVCKGDSGAKQVFLAGDFNDWDPTATRMRGRNGSFRKKMELAPGEYHYKFVVDGEWQTDPASMIQMANDKGSTNSVVHV